MSHHLFIHCTTINLKEVIMEDHMVKHFSDLLFQGINYAPFLTEYCEGLFLRVLGHAAAKLIKQKLQQSADS